MTVKVQHPIKITDTCDCMVHYGELVRAISWYQERPTCGKKTIYMQGRYPAVSIHREKIHIHTLLIRYWFQRRRLPEGWCVHHKDGDPKNNLFLNLWVVPKSAHTSFHLRGRKPTPQCIQATIAANKKRRGHRYKERIHIDLNILVQLLHAGKSINAIAKFFQCDWSTIRSRIDDNLELLEDKP